MAGCTSKVLFVFALLFVSAYADIASHRSDSERDDDEGFVMEVDDVHLNTDQKYSETEDDDSFDEEVENVDLNTERKDSMGRQNRSPAWRKKGSQDWKQNKGQAWKKNNGKGRRKNKGGKKNKRGGRKNDAPSSGNSERPWQNETPLEAAPVVVKPFEEPQKPIQPVNPVKPGAFNGKWELVTNNAGVSSMHAILIPKINKVLMYDATIWKVSQIELTKEQRPCRFVDGVMDCWAHAVFFDYTTGTSKPLKLATDTWCSSGGLLVDGTLVSTGGNKGGSTTVRYLTPCENCDWKEYPDSLANQRWYGTQVTLADGSFIVAGGRGSASYEYIPPQGQSNKMATPFPFLIETKNSIPSPVPNKPNYELENNLYPFLHLAPDGNVFFFANNRSVLLDPKNNKIIREFPVLEGGPRNYPASGSSALLPIKLDPQNPNKTPVVEVLVCGGAIYDAYFITDALKRKPFPPALKDCGRMDITSANPVWKREDMPSPRVMGDMMILPSGELLIINGAKRGSSGWNDAEEPNFVPVLYKPDSPEGRRFSELEGSTIPRMYHSAATVLPDGKVLISGSNTNDGYVYKPKVEFSTELRVEKFSPHYLGPEFDEVRPEIVFESSDNVTKYGANLSILVKAKQVMTKNDIQVTMYSPAFSTHGVNMNQRLLVLGIVDVLNSPAGAQTIVAVAPPSGKIAPPGYYLLSVVYRGIPSKLSMWLQIK